MRRSLASSGALIAGLLLCVAVELVLFASLFEPPPRTHTDAYLAAVKEAQRNPSNENYQKLGQQGQIELTRPAWKDPTAIEYYAGAMFGMIAFGFGIIQIHRRLRLGRDPIRISHHAAK